jgi:hypothetical protein
MQKLENKEILYKLAQKNPWVLNSKVQINNFAFYLRDLSSHNTNGDKMFKMVPLFTEVDIGILDKLKEFFISTEIEFSPPNSFGVSIFFQYPTNDFIAKARIRPNKDNITLFFELFLTDLNKYMEFCELVKKYTYEEKQGFGFGVN